MAAADEAILVEEAICGLLRLVELYRDSISADFALVMSAQGEWPSASAEASGDSNDRQKQVLEAATRIPRELGITESLLATLQSFNYLVKDKNRGYKLPTLIGALGRWFETRDAHGSFTTKFEDCIPQFLCFSWGGIKAVKAGSAAPKTERVQTPGVTKKGICYNWNRGKCKKSAAKCKYTHKCQECSGSHRRVNCPKWKAKQSSTQPNNPFSSGFGANQSQGYGRGPGFGRGTRFPYNQNWA